MNAHFSDPKETLLQFGLQPGMKVADLGSGTGHYTKIAAEIVGKTGKVYAVDVQEDVLTHAKAIHGHMHHHHLHGVIETVWGDIEKLAGTKIREQALDAVILTNVLFQVNDRKTLIEEIKRILKSGGKLLVVDWAGAYGGMGPHASQVVSEHAAEELFIGAGFHKVKSFRSGAHHYALIFTSP